MTSYPATSAESVQVNPAHIYTTGDRYLETGLLLEQLTRRLEGTTPIRSTGLIHVGERYIVGRAGGVHCVAAAFLRNVLTNIYTGTISAIIEQELEEDTFGNAESILDLLTITLEEHPEGITIPQQERRVILKEDNLVVVDAAGTSTVLWTPS